MIQPDTEARNGMKSRGHLALSSFLGLGLALALGSCSSMPVEREQDVTARALLDHTTGEIVLPLDEYDPFDSDSVGLLVDRAFDISTAKCMSRRGLQYTAAAVEEDPQHGTGGRTYGLWDEDRARAYGYGYAPSLVDAAKEADAQAGGPGWESAVDDCSTDEDDELAALIPTNEESVDSLVARIRTDSYNAAASDAGWQNARDEWSQCLRSLVLSPRTSGGGGNSEQGEGLVTSIRPDGSSPDREEEIRVASLEAQCDTETGLSQILGDLEASYQAPLIKQNQAALNRIKTRNQDRLAGLRAYVAAHG
jgi:hypothetical protein